MGEKVFEKFQAQEESQFKDRITDALNTALNCKETQRRASEVNSTPGASWPYLPTKEILKLYEQVANEEWGRLQKQYDFLKVSIDINAPKGKPPGALVDAKYDGEFKGGMSYQVRVGDTLNSIAKSIYGHEVYAHYLYEENAKSLGNQSQQFPANFGIEVPLIFVPQWQRPPKASGKANTNLKAVKILYPALEINVKKSRCTLPPMLCGALVIEVTVVVEATLAVQQKGTIDASFNLSSYEASAEGMVGKLGAGFKYSALEKDKTKFTIINELAPGLTINYEIPKKPGTFKTSIKKTVSFEYKNFVAKGSVEVSLEIRVKDNRLPERVKKPQPLRLTNEEVELILVVVIVGVAVGVCLTSAGGACIPAAGFAGQLILAH